MGWEGGCELEPADVAVLARDDDAGCDDAARDGADRDDAARAERVERWDRAMTPV